MADPIRQRQEDGLRNRVSWVSWEEHQLLREEIAGMWTLLWGAVFVIVLQSAGLLIALMFPAQR